ncbi:MAG: hypothetical protein DCF27_10810 [Lysobacteraceae bacterium]|nr:MAG: hypothetical protein DCF27_10810 [Xanthomonadaceae bacterium]
MCRHPVAPFIKGHPMSIRIPFAIALLACSAAAFASKPMQTDAPTPILGGSLDADLTCEPMPGEPAGHFICEDADRFKRCQEILEANGKVRLEGETKDTPVLMCLQGG